MATLYVSNTASNGYSVGNDINNGLTKSAAKLSGEAAISSAVNGDTIVFNSGTFVALTYYTVNKGIFLMPEFDFLTTLGGQSAMSVVHVNNESGEAKIGRFVIDTSAAGAGSAITLNNAAASVARVIDGPRLKIGTSAAITDYYNRGVVRINCEIFGSGGSFGYLGSTSAAELADKTVEISRLDFGEFVSGNGQFIGASISRKASSPAANLYVDVSGVVGTISTPNGVAGAHIYGVLVTGATNVDVHDIDLTIQKDGLSASVECVGIEVRATSQTAPTTSAVIRDSKINLFAPAGNGINGGGTGAVDYCQSVVISDCEATGQYYAVATPHGIGLRGQGPGSKIYRCKSSNFYVGFIQSYCNGSMVFNNVTDGCYGVDLYAKGCGASSAPVFANNTMIKRNRVGDMRSDLACMAANVQGTKVNTDTKFINNRAVLVDMTTKMSLVAPSQNATFERNGYPKTSALVAESFSWHDTTMDATAWAAAHESDMVHEFERVAVTTDGQMSDFSRLAHVGKTVTGVTDSDLTDPWGNAFPAHPNLGADQGAAPSFGPWAQFDGTMPTDGQICKSHAAPIAAKKITVFDGVASQSQINEAAE